MKKPETSWGGVAEWYDELVEGSPDSYQKNVLMPNLIRVVAPAKGMTILDVACGQGYFSRAFAQNGAEVTGSDISGELITLAREQESKAEAEKKAGRTKIQYRIAPADDLSFAADASADVVTVILALQNIENLAGTFAESARILKSGGRLIVAINHPAFRIPHRSSWQWDEAEAKQFRRIDGYMSDDRIKVDMTPGEPDAAKKKLTISFHRPLQSYLKALSKAGLAVTRLEEWISHRKSQAGPRAAEEDRIRKEIPLFMCLEARKL